MALAIGQAVAVGPCVRNAGCLSAVHDDGLPRLERRAGGWRLRSDRRGPRGLCPSCWLLGRGGLASSDVSCTRGSLPPRCYCATSVMLDECGRTPAVLWSSCYGYGYRLAAARRTGRHPIGWAVALDLV
jgi:hypothetical protein